jgi:hypothetical protein
MALRAGEYEQDTALIGQVLRGIRQILPDTSPESLAWRLL